MKKFFRSFVYAVQGIGIAIREQPNLKVQLVIALVVVAAGFYYDLTVAEWCLILLTIAFVMGLEFINSALETLVDLVTREYHPLAGKVKDIAAGAVLFAAVIAVIIGALIFYKYLFPGPGGMG